jgi:PAS domain S-box-containing protein
MDDPQNKKIIIAASLLVIATGFTVMAGWIFNVPALESIVHGFIAMSFNAALSFVLFGTALLITQYQTGRYNRLIFFVLSLLGAAIGMITISQDLFHYNSGLDQLFVNDKTIPSYSFPYPGRMAFNASINLTFMGLGFLLLTSKKRIFNTVSQYLFHLVTILSAIALIGYLYGVSFFRVLLYRTSMATHTAILFFVLSLAVSLINPSIGLSRLFTGKKVGNQMAKRLFTLIIVMIILFGVLRISSRHFRLFSSLGIGMSLLAVGFLMVSLALIWNTANWLNSVDKKRSEAEDEIRRMNAGLEKMVEERSAEFQKSEEKYRSLVEQASDAIYIIDNTGSFTDSNESMCKMIGYSRDELLQMDVASIIDPEELAKDPVPDGLVNRWGSVIRERTFRRKDGLIFTVEINAKLFADNRIMVIARDITSRKKMEAELRDAELKFRTIADKSMVGVYIAQNDRFTYVNPRFAAIFGYEPEELINTVPVYAILHESFKPVARENIRKRLAGEIDSVHYEAIGQRKDGTSNWVEFYGSKASFGGQRAIMGSMIDISERKRAEEALKSSELKYKLLFDSNPMPMWMIAKDDQSIIAVNDAAANQYGYDKEELLQMNVRDIRPTEDREKQLEGYRQNYGDSSHRVTVRHLKKDGTLMFIQISARDIVFEGRPVRLSMTLDITEKLKAEAALREMAWKQSHLIRSPLANLKGLAAMLKENPAEAAVFNHIENELNRMDAILIEMANEFSDKSDKEAFNISV